MPSMFTRKTWTKCWRDCSPSVTMSTPASSCSLTAIMVASRLARASSSPDDFQGAHSLLGSASHSGFGREPAMVVGNSMDVPLVLDLGVYLPCLAEEVHMASTATDSILGYEDENRRTSHDRPLLRADAEWLENLDHAGGNRASLQRVSRQHPRRRTVQAGVSGDQPEQPDSRNHRPRPARRQ